ncbi:MAG: hypothetical protein RLZ51_313 [Pseudomonadota bacterium]|jgi:hypothetical protein
MYIIAIAWIYVVLMMALTEASVVAGISTFVFYGLAPLALLLWLLGTPQRRRARKAREDAEALVSASPAASSLTETSDASESTAPPQPSARQPDQ